MSEVCPSHDPTPLVTAREGAPEETDRRSALRVVKTQTRPRRLLLCLDGVPFDVVTEAKSRGLFDNFNDPARLLSPFPTLTNVALAQMLCASPPNGYESLYFDREARELRGGVRKYIGRRTPDKVPSSYMDELDYQEPLPFEFLIYVATDAVWRADMQRFRERFLSAPPARDFFGFLKATDGLLHIGGPARLGVALRSLDKLLREIQKECGSETEIVLFSDHGMNLEENRRTHLQKHLRSCGYDVLFRYEQVDGDPLGLAEVVRALKDEGRLDERGFAADAAWLAHTWRHEYPDALSNIYESVHAPRVRHTADVLVSLRDGYYYGSTPFSHFARILATHGNALRPSSTAFLRSEEHTSELQSLRH